MSLSDIATMDPAQRVAVANWLKAYTSPAKSYQGFYKYLLEAQFGYLSNGQLNAIMLYDLNYVPDLRDDLEQPLVRWGWKWNWRQIRKDYGYLTKSNDADVIITAAHNTLWIKK